jgi:prepilin-type N-terminal cleavage/methylation domain-containing protein
MTRQTAARSGMTLIEVMIALGILTGALLGMGTFITKFSHATTDGSIIAAATDLATDRLEQVKAWNRYSTLESTFSATESSIPGYPGYVRTTQITNTVTPQTNYKTVTVTVTKSNLTKPVKKTTIIAAF